MAEKEILFSVTKKDLVFEYFSGSGAGGQHRNKHQNACRCRHPPSGALGTCQDERSKDQNTKRAFSRMVATKAFQNWIKLETARLTGALAECERKADKAVKQAKLEIHDENGRWVEVPLNSELDEEEHV